MRTDKGKAEVLVRTKDELLSARRRAKNKTRTKTKTRPSSTAIAVDDKNKDFRVLQRQNGCQLVFCKIFGGKIGFMPLYSPASSVAQYQLLPQTIDPADNIDTILLHIDYSFKRVQRWSTRVQRYNDQGIEIMPRQVILQNDFEITLTRFTENDIRTLESYIDAHFGEAQPFYFTAPDDNTAYVVIFGESGISYTVINAAVRTATIKLTDAGDVDNSINNDLVYPSYVEPPEIVLASGASAGSSVAINVNTTRRLATGTIVAIGFGSHDQEATTVISVVNSTQFTANLTNSHVSGELVTVV
jgi:hypothetical protein